jgi:phosphate transport system protein
MEEECLKILALHQPVGSDLRLIVAILKINNDLERIGDLSVNIAERAVFLASPETIDIPLDFARMAENVESMLRRSLDALVNTDLAAAHEVLEADDEVDAINREMYVQVQDAIRQHPQRVERLIHLLSASRHLERIADHATNIAEDVIYMIEGEIVRHREEEYHASSESG